MLNNLRGLSFFDEGAVAKSFQLLSIYSALASRDKKQLIDDLRRIVGEFAARAGNGDGVRLERGGNSGGDRQWKRQH